MSPQDLTEIADAPFQWRDRSWRGLPWHYSVIQEIDVGTYTPSGTFAALAAKIPHLSDLGITALQLMPIGVPSSSLGRPEQLKTLIDKAHDYGLMVLLDLRALEHVTLESAVGWLREFHLDGVRVSESLCAELTRVVRDQFSNRYIHVIPESSAKRRAACGVDRRASRRHSQARHRAATRRGTARQTRRRSTRGPFSADAVRAVSAIQLLHPQISPPFMGEEWEADEALALHSAKLDWSALRQPDGAAAFERYQQLLTIRRNEVSPRLPSIASAGRAELLSEHSFRIEWVVGDTELLTLEANLSERTDHVAQKDARRLLWAEGDCAPGRVLPPWSVLWTIRRTG